MLTLQILREQTDMVLEGLKKRNFKDAETLVQQLIENDKLRRETQNTLDTLKAKSNADSKKIGDLMRAGKADEANALRASIALDKDKVKSLEASLTEFEKKQQEILYKIPNVPAPKVPAGKSAEDNINVYEHGTVPALPSDA
ncbi:MAG TPA: serine--tRNA ligase, partial [Cyclobacteriaceae bacterium]|nr:serine--tRNA ligase [Cyclobacteriaceae bacterium]